MAKATVVLSGGQDSTTCLHWAKQQSFDEIAAVTFDYGQRHDEEIFAAEKIAKMAGVTNHTVLILSPDTLRSDSPLTSNNDLEQYEDHASLPGGLEKTFVPMRNQTFLTIAAAEAYRNGHTHLITGVCQEDFGGYPDCRRVFVDAVENACNLGTFTGKDGALPNLNIHTPLMDLTKAQSVDLAIRLGWDCWRALAYSHTAYDGAFPPTGHDHATLLRAKGFEQHGTPDPLVLRAIVSSTGMDIPDSKNYSMARYLLKHDDALANENDESLLRACWDDILNSTGATDA